MGSSQHEEFYYDMYTQYKSGGVVTIKEICKSKSLSSITNLFECIYNSMLKEDDLYKIGDKSDLYFEYKDLTDKKYSYKYYIEKIEEVMLYDNEEFKIEDIEVRHVFKFVKGADIK
jgi:hypothetical protein